MLSQLLADHAALQRALGYKFRNPGILLRNFVTFAECRGERVITTATVREWPVVKDGLMTLSHAQFEALFSGLDWRRVQAIAARAPEAVQ